MSEKVKKYIIKISLSMLVIIILSISIFINQVIAPYFSNRIPIVDKDVVNTDTIDVILPNIDNITNSENKGNVESNKSPIESSKPVDIYYQEQKSDDIVNILLVGMDARQYQTVSRSDTMILVSYNKTKHSIKMVSFLRDTWVYIPEMGWQRINAATAFGGTGLLINTINYNFDLDIQNYIQVRFEDFETIVNILGGIDVELTWDEIQYINYKLHTEDFDYSNDIIEEPGVIHLNGKQALWHCRNRSIGNSDWSRTERQRDVLNILLQKGMSMSISQAALMIYELREHCNTNLDIYNILVLCKDALISKNISVESVALPFDDTWQYENIEGMSVMTIDLERTKEILHKFLEIE